MPVRYSISPSLKMIFFICRGIVNGPELFAASELAQYDDRFQYGMTIIIDLFSARDNFEFQDIMNAMQRMNKTAEEGHARAKIVILSMSTGINLLVEAMRILPSKVPLNIRVFPSLDQAIASLGLRELSREIFQFWQESHAARPPGGHPRSLSGGH
jgi:hypothetical protein